MSTAVKVHFVLAAGYRLTLTEIGLGFVVDVGFFYLACSMLGLGFRFPHQRADDAAEPARMSEERPRAIHAEAVATERNRLARDLHDLAAHELMDVLLTARAMQITSDDPCLMEIEQKTARPRQHARGGAHTARGPQRRRTGPSTASRGRDPPHRYPSRRTQHPRAGTHRCAWAGRRRDHLDGAERAHGDAPQRRPPRARHADHGCARLLGGTFDVRQAENGDWIAALYLPPNATHTEVPTMSEAR